MQPPEFLGSTSRRRQIEAFCAQYCAERIRAMSNGLATCGDSPGLPISTSDSCRPRVALTPININRPLLDEFAKVLVGLLQDYISDDFHKLRTIIDFPQTLGSEMFELVGHVLKGDGAYLANLANKFDVSLDRLAFFANYLARPVRQAAAIDSTDNWHLGYCPVCGLWPRMAQIDAEDGHRSLWCVGCETVWSFPRLLCPFCLESDQGRLGYLRIADTERYRLYVCETCRRYLKTVIDSTPAKSQSSHLDEEYHLTAALDATAAFEKYIQDFVGFAAFDLQDNVASRSYITKALTKV